MASSLEARLDKFLLTDRIDRTARLIARETKREALIVERRARRRVPGVEFIPREWLELGGVATSYASQVLP